VDDIQRWDAVDTMYEVSTGEWVTYADHLAAVASEYERGRVDECAQRTLVYGNLLAAERQQGVSDEREACIAAVSAPTLHDDACCSNGCTLMHSSEWEATRRIQIALGFPLSEEPPPPYRCDGSCNCTAAAFIAAIRAREEKP